jgi:FAD:protein FMN transferase
MTKRFSLSASPIASLMVCALAAGTARGGQDYEYRHENVLGTSLKLCVRANTEEAARSAEARALDEIDRLAAVFSNFDASSEFLRWQATVGQPMKVSQALFELLRESDRWRGESAGAFDPRVQALTELWSRCARLDRLPTADESEVRDWPNAERSALVRRAGSPALDRGKSGEAVVAN